MLLAGDDVVEAAHQLNAAALEVDWQATGKIEGALEEWRERTRIAEIVELRRRGDRSVGQITYPRCSCSPQDMEAPGRWRRGMHQRPGCSQA
ncbi:hypothetical protein ABZW18_27105 [Streptomyces sp. NPDC004647]|uniref:hypothetical protein n=1 Tax=Streptomyces sp. NPDC004647 TaxID=3154671 RepID=UPI00339DC19B